jgi:hypothetical protein
MNLSGHIISSIKKRTVLSDGWNYAIANWRYRLYYKCKGRFKFLIRRHIREQFEYRLKIMHHECYKSGACIRCGCQVPSLQFTNKTCEGLCYLPLMSSTRWKLFKIEKDIK